MAKKIIEKFMIFFLWKEDWFLFFVTPGSKLVFIERKELGEVSEQINQEINSKKPRIIFGF